MGFIKNCAPIFIIFSYTVFIKFRRFITIFDIFEAFVCFDEPIFLRIKKGSPTSRWCATLNEKPSYQMTMITLQLYGTDSPSVRASPRTPRQHSQSRQTVSEYVKNPSIF